MTSSGHITPRHILVVDDEPQVREAMQLLLELDGHQVAEADSAAKALALFEPGKFDLVLTDYLMPRMTGDELALAIKQRSPGQPVVMLTAFPEKLEQPARPRAGVDLVIGKPFGMENLRHAVAQCGVVQKMD